MNKNNEVLKQKQKTLFSRRRKLIDCATPSELIFYKRLSDLNINFIFQKGFIAGHGYYFADFYLPRPIKTVIEIDGGYHDHPKQIQYDKRKDKYFIEFRKIKVIRIKNSEVNSFNLSVFLKP